MHAAHLLQAVRGLQLEEVLRRNGLTKARLRQLEKRMHHDVCKHAQTGQQMLCIADICSKMCCYPRQAIQSVLHLLIHIVFCNVAAMVMCKCTHSNEPLAFHAVSTTIAQRYASRLYMQSARLILHQRQMML